MAWESFYFIANVGKIWMYFGRWRNRFGMMSFVGEFSLFFFCFLFFSRREAYSSSSLFLVLYRDPVIQTNYGYFMGILNTLTDVWLAILPAVLVHRTKMRLRRKIGVAGLLCLGLWASVASGVKTVEVSLFLSSPLRKHFQSI